MSKRAWTAEEDSFLIERWGKGAYFKNIERLAYRLNRSVPEIRMRAYRFKKGGCIETPKAISKKGGHGRKWTEDELQILKTSWSSQSSFEISKSVQRSIDAIRSKAKNLGLKGGRNHVYIQSSPNKPETILDELLQANFPNEYRFNGDYSQGVTLGGLIPDWINVNGKKQVIELFGEYWHDGKRRKVRWKSTEFGRKAVYSQLGFECLIIWTNELKSPNEVIDKIRSFV